MNPTTAATAEARRNHLKQQLDRAAEIEGSDPRTLPGMKDTLGLLARALRAVGRKKARRNSPA
jgi:hypothetical protein